MTIIVSIADLQALTNGSTQSCSIDVRDASSNPATQEAESFTANPSVVPLLLDLAGDGLDCHNLKESSARCYENGSGAIS